MGSPAPEVGDSVVVTANLSALKDAVLAIPDDLDWDAATYTPAVGKSGTVSALDDATASVQLSDTGATVEIPLTCLSPQAPVRPEDVELTATASPPASPQRESSGGGGGNAVFPKGSTVTIQSSLEVVKKEVKRYPDDLEWEESVFRPVLGKKATVVDVTDAIVDVVLVDGGAHISLPMSALHPQKSPQRRAPPQVRAKQAPSGASARPTNLPIVRSAALAPLAVGSLVTVQANKAVLKSMIGFFPDDLEWDEGSMADAAGKTAEVVGVDGEFLDVRVEGHTEQICLPRNAVVVADSSSPRAPAVTAPNNKPTVTSPVVTAATAAPFNARKGDEVQVTANKELLQAEVAKHPDDIEWDESSHGAAVGLTGHVEDVDGALCDVKVSEELTVTVPNTCLSSARSSPPPPLSAHKAAFAHQKPSAARLVTITSNVAVLTEHAPAHVDKAGQTGRVVSFSTADNKAVVLLDKSHTEITLPAEVFLQANKTKYAHPTRGTTPHHPFYPAEPLSRRVLSR